MAHPGYLPAPSLTARPGEPGDSPTIGSQTPENGFMLLKEGRP